VQRWHDGGGFRLHSWPQKQPEPYKPNQVPHEAGHQTAQEQPWYVDRHLNTL
jgi:hypothetical protein